MKIITVLPVSRAKYLDRVLESLLNQTYKIENLLVVYDGPQNDLIKVRNRITELEIDNRLCVQSNHIRCAFSIPDRRNHIANIHNQVGEIINDADWVFSIEDDGILPPDALQRLVDIVNSKTDAGMATGVELGRWGVPYVGAWRVDNVDDIKTITSAENKTDQVSLIEEIDACGLYCALIKADQYMQHNFFANNGLGPDVNLGIFIRKQGLKIYIDWGIPLTHLTNYQGVEVEIPATSASRIVKLRLLSGSIWEAQKE